MSVHIDVSPFRLWRFRVGKLSRRDFFVSVGISFAVGKAAIQALLNGSPYEFATHASDPAPPGEYPFEVDDTRPECDGWGRLICPACDGTRRWTESSESAGLYQREAARHADRCAWCDQWGEIDCPECEGMGSSGFLGRARQVRTHWNHEGNM